MMMAGSKRCLGCGQNKLLGGFHEVGSSFLCIECSSKHKRLCRKCKRERSIKEFPKDENGMISHCQECINDEKPIVDSGKECIFCEKVKPWKEYHRDKRSEDGRRSSCKECDALRYGKSIRVCHFCKQRKMGKEFPKRNNGVTKYCLQCVQTHTLEKQCSSCKEYLPQKAFYRSKHSKDGRRASCKKCCDRHRRSKVCERCGKQKRKRAFPNDSKEHTTRCCLECVRKYNLQKWCSSCKKDLPQECFPEDKAKRDGRGSHCRECRRQYYHKKKGML